MGQAGSTFQYWCCLTLLIIRPCFQLLITFSYLDWNFPHWMSASGWIFWNFLARTVAIFESHSNGKGITSNIWKKFCELSLDSTFMLCTASTNSIKDMVDFLPRRHLLSSWWKSVQSLFSFEKKKILQFACAGNLGTLGLYSPSTCGWCQWVGES